MNEQSEILNLYHHYKIMAVKALNKSENMKEAARFLGVGLRTLTRWKKDFNIQFDGQKYFTV